ncbi:hypothetical protein SDJN03_05699, partial [Cucurbita argyrosperma subsp. sororia]
MDKSDIQYVLAEESRTTNSYVIEICSDNREGRNKAVGLVIEADWIFASARNTALASLDVTSVWIMSAFDCK